MTNAQQAVPPPSTGTLLGAEAASLRRQIVRVWDDRFVPYFLVAFIFWIVCVVESIQQIGGQKLDPRFWMFLSVLVTIYGGFRIFRLRAQGGNLLPVPGGLQVNEVLDRLRSKGFVAYDEVRCDDWSADHIVVGPGGIYVIESKTRNVFGSRAIDYRSDNELVLGGKITDTQPLKQARNAASAIRQDIEDHLQQQYPVHALVVFVGLWRVNQPSIKVDVDVLAAHDLEDYFDRQQARLTSDQIGRICSYLEHSELTPTS